MQTNPFLKILFLIAFLLLLSYTPQSANGQAPTTMSALWEMINTSRQNNGVGRLAWNNLLAQAAQQHAQDIGNHNLEGHIGSDGSTPEERATRLGYRSYPDTILVAQNWATGSTSEAFALFLEDSLNRNNMWSPIWREAGIGMAPSSVGEQVWVVVFGAQPGVLPLFVNHDEPRTTEQRVTVQLRAEESVYDSSSFTAPIEMRVAEAHQIADVPWQAWQSEIGLELSPSRGEKVVVAELRDAQGRIVRSQDRILFEPSSQSLLTPSVEVTPSGTAFVTFSPTLTPLITLTEVRLTLTPTATGSPTLPTMTLTPSVTSSPERTVIPTVTSTPTTISSNPSIENTLTPTATLPVVAATASATLTVISSNEGRRTATPNLISTSLPTVSPMRTLSSADETTMELISSSEKASTPTTFATATQRSRLTTTATGESSQTSILTPTKQVKAAALATPVSFSTPTASVTSPAISEQIMRLFPIATPKGRLLWLIMTNRTVSLIILITIELILFVAMLDYFIYSSLR